MKAAQKLFERLRKMSPKLKLLLMLPSPILLLSSGCALVSTKPVAPISEFCRVVDPITYDSRVDSADTVAQIEALNAKWLALCDEPSAVTDG